MRLKKGKGAKGAMVHSQSGGGMMAWLEVEGEKGTRGRVPTYISKRKTRNTAEAASPDSLCLR